jgi:hypothetical protein
MQILDYKLPAVIFVAFCALTSHLTVGRSTPIIMAGLLFLLLLKERS